MDRPRTPPPIITTSWIIVPRRPDSPRPRPRFSGCLCSLNLKRGSAAGVRSLPLFLSSPRRLLLSAVFSLLSSSYPGLGGHHLQAPQPAQANAPLSGVFAGG